MSHEEKVEKRAYELFMQRGGVHGYAIEDWLQAEKEISGQSAKPDSKAKKESKKK